MRNVQCPQCQSKLRVPESRASFACPKCGKPLRMQSIDPQETSQRWMMRHVDGVEYGPYLSQDIAGFIAEMRVLQNSELKHATETAGKWVIAERVPQFAGAFTISEPVKPAPPPVQAMPKLPPPTPLFSQTSNSSSGKPRINKAQRRALVSIACGLASAFIASALGLVLSQYFPVFGGVLERGLAVPWSPARMSLIPVHILAFSLLGLVIGSIGGMLVATLFSSEGR
jgi:predicted RNA-binding Zn-ribbon protein involved in translation (DUF1610 family)